MKVYFASLTDMTLTVDAWVSTIEQGYVVLAALADKFNSHVVVMRARVQRYQNYEERYIGPASGVDVDDFLNRVACIGGNEPDYIMRSLPDPIPSEGEDHEQES